MAIIITKGLRRLIQSHTHTASVCKSTMSKC